MKIININHNPFPAMATTGMLAKALLARGYEVEPLIYREFKDLTADAARAKVLEQLRIDLPEPGARAIVLLEANLGESGGPCRFNGKFFHSLRTTFPNVRFVLHYGGESNIAFDDPPNYPDTVLAIFAKGANNEGFQWLAETLFPVVTPLPCRPSVAWPYPTGTVKNGPKL
jgi:hypothetical protein